MQTIEFYGAGGLEMTHRLKKALERYVKNCYSLNNEWNFIGTNLDKAVQKDQSEPIILSIPIYFQNEESGFDNNPFFSFEKIIIDKKDQKYISDFSQIFCDDDNLMIEKNGQTASVVFQDDRFCKKINHILENIAKLPTSHENMKIRTLNIQSGDVKFWNKELKQVFSPENKNTFYIFYWKKHHEDISLEKELEIIKNNPEFLKKTKNRYEIHDRVWGFSKFMRDYLKIRNRCYEWEFFEMKCFVENNEVLDLIQQKVKKEPLDSELNLIEKVNRIFNGCDSENSNYEFNLGDISTLHLYNRNNHFQSDFFEKKFEKKISNATGSAHQLLNKKDNLLLKLNEQNILKLGLLENKLFFYDLFKNVTDACISFKKLEKDIVPEFIFLDDVAPIKLEYWNKYSRLHDWFPDSNFYYSNDPDFLKYLFDNVDKSEKNAEKFIFENTQPKFVDYRIKKFKTDKIHPLFIGIDIDWNGEQYGFNLLKQFRRNVHLMKRPCFIFVFSRFEYPSTIRKAVASGALFYVTKQNYMNLVHKVYQILRRINAEEIVHSKYRTYESWHLLNKLEPAKVVQLKSEFIKGFPDTVSGNKLQIKKQEHQWKWIRRLPKADLHCHIGSCLGPDLLPLTAILVLSEKFNSPKSAIKENLKLIIDFICLLAKDLSLNKEKKVELGNINLVENFGFNKTEYSCVFELLINECKLTENLIFPEVVLINPKDTTIERIFPNIDYCKPYFEKREELRKAKVEYDDLILFFILLIYIRENGIQKDKLHETIKESLRTIISLEHEKRIQNTNVDFGDFIKDISELIDFKDLSGDKSNSTNLLNHLQSSRGKSNSLFTYLQGCEYGGSAHLQTKASISLACYYIVHRYAIPDNIRYLTLRCAVDGYSKSGILTNDTAMQALLNGFDKAVKLTKKRIHVDLILTAKRHKSTKEFEENVLLALQYRNGLNLPKGFDNNIDDSFFKTKTKVVSFDLAGLEEGNRASKYLPQFMPLLRKCFPITIHAGEEDDHEAIWEAIYLVQSQRIGHGLTLRDNPDLIELVRDRHIAIELCPLSNILTRKVKYDAIPLENRNDKNIYKDQKKNYYPLRQYLMENLDVTINTDNPFVSGSTLTEEYLIAAHLAGGLTKWEILRLVKNSFRSAAIPKELKKLLMNEIDDEIYNILLEE